MALNSYSQQPQVMIADTETECYDRIKKVYGNNVQILRKRELTTRGFLPFIQKKQCEVSYMPLLPEAKKMYQGFSQPSSQMDFNEEKAKILEANQGTQNPQMKLILDEIKELHSKLDEKNANIRQDDHATILDIEEILKKNDFTTEYIKKIVERIRKEFSLEELEDVEIVQKAVVDWIGESISVTDVSVASRPETIILVGPTGIGKTTTVAKLAAFFSGLGNTTVPQGLNIRLITTDSVRIGAKEQLETYGELMGIPVSFSNSEEDLQELLRLYGRDSDVILIDTAGHSPKDYESLIKMRKTLEFKGHKPRVFLTISAPTKANDLRTILQQYEIFGYTSVIVTKIDETETIGTVVSILDEKQKSIAYITDGQKVPRNFKKADPVSFLINLTGFTIDRDHIDEKFIQEKIG